MLRVHVNKRMKESKCVLISKDGELSNKNEKNVIISESRCFAESSSRGFVTPEVFTFNSFDEIQDGLFSVQDDMDFDINQSENSSYTVV